MTKRPEDASDPKSSDQQTKTETRVRTLMKMTMQKGVITVITVISLAINIKGSELASHAPTKMMEDYLAHSECPTQIS